MALDAYSPCPGGTGKKIKFCCHDLLSELQTIERMLEGEQFQACLTLVQAGLAKTPDRACLLATRSLLLRVTEQWDAAAEATAEFLRKHPDNPIAWAEQAIVTASREGGRAALPVLQRALAGSGEQMEMRVYEAIGQVAETLAVQGEVMAAAPLLLIQVSLNPDDNRPAMLLMELNRANDVPLLEKSERHLPEAPTDAPWKAAYDEALSPVHAACWAEAAEQVTSLLQGSPEEPIFWRALATLRAWLADTPGCVAALEKYASLPIALEDAVEAQALALTISEDALGDSLDVLKASFTVKDVEEVLTACAASPQVVPARVDPMTLVEGDEPPPKGVYYLLDRPALAGGVEPTLENVPRMYCHALLFGRQTDREARLVLQGLRSSRLEEVSALLRNIAGEQISGPDETTVAGKISQTQDLLLPNFWTSDQATLAQLQQLSAESQRQALRECWTQLPLGLFGGKTPREAAAEEPYRIRLLAAIFLIESWFESRPERFDLNWLREALGLPALGPIDPRQVNLTTLPLVRLARVEASLLDDEQLLNLFRVATTFAIIPAVKRLGETILERPSLAEREELPGVLMNLARQEGTSDRAIEYLERGRKMAVAHHQSCASWDLMEMPLRLSRGEANHLTRLMDHIQAKHLREPGVQEALFRFLVRIGAVRPDGVPATPPGAVPGAMAAEPAAEPGKLWTPESQRPAEERKIWMPGME